METPNYTARVIDSGDITGYIDIQPPIGAISEDFLSDFGVDNGTTVDHKLTTAVTTRLSVTIEDEGLSVKDRIEAFEGTARYILRSLTDTDQGFDTSGRVPDHTTVLRSSEL